MNDSVHSNIHSWPQFAWKPWLLSAAMLLVVALGGCGGAAPVHKNTQAPAKVRKTGAEAAKTDTAKAAPAKSKHREPETVAAVPRDRSEELSGELRVAGDPEVDSPRAAQAVEVERTMDEAPASGGGGGGFFEGDTYEDDETPRAKVRDLVEEIEEAIDEYKQEHGVTDYAVAAPDSCEQVCELSEAICESSKKICNIAQSNPPEAWFGDRCQWSAGECERSSARCTQCNI